MKISYLISLLIYIFLLISPANAGKIDLIINLFKGGKKLITGGADEAKDVGKVLEDFKGGNDEVKDFSKVIEDLKGGDKVDETFGISGQLDESRYIKYQETTISEFENLSVEDLVKKHGIKNIKNVDGLLDIIDGVELSKNLLETTLIHPYINYNWQGKVFKSSIFFNDPSIKDKILIKCASNLEMLYFTAILNQDPKNYLLLSGNFINKKRVSGKKSMKRQEMLVLEDFNEYIVFSNKPKEIKKFPSRYFLISSDKKFLYEMNFRETNTPQDFTKNINSKMIKTKFLCKRIL